MAISNPCTWFTTGGSFEDQESFTYEGGNILFHFSTDMIKHRLFECWIPINLIFMAKDETHALDVLIRMFEYCIKCHIQHSEYHQKKKGVYWQQDVEKITKQSEVAHIILEYLRSGKIVPQRAPVDQFYQVGWASNDTIL